MFLKMKTQFRSEQTGSSLIEVLVALLILSFGMLSLGGMLSFAVQMPKLAGYRATAASIASAHIEKMRANPGGFRSDSYSSPLSYDGTLNDNITVVDCSYPNCSESDLANWDITATQRAARVQLPAGGMIMKCDVSPCNQFSYGNIWVMWQEPETLAAIDPASSDYCPAEVVNGLFNPKPRCLYVRFKIE